MDNSQSDSSELAADSESTFIVYEIPIETFIHDYDDLNDKTNDEPQTNMIAVKPSTIRSRRCRARQKMFKAAAEAANPTVPKVAKTIAQRCKEYRERQKILKISGEYCPSYLTNSNVKSPAQRAREYRHRLRLKREEELQNLCQSRQDIEMSRLTPDNMKCSPPPQKAHNTRAATTRIKQQEEVMNLRRSNTYSSYAPASLDMDMNESSSSEPVDVKLSIHSPSFALNASSSNEHKPYPLNEDSSFSTAFMSAEDSSFFQFFRGIHGEYLELPAKKRTQFRRKCVDFMFELLDDDNHSQISDYPPRVDTLHLSKRT